MNVVFKHLMEKIMKQERIGRVGQTTNAAYFSGEAARQRCGVYFMYQKNKPRPANRGGGQARRAAMAARVSEESRSTRKSKR